MFNWNFKTLSSISDSLDFDSLIILLIELFLIFLGNTSQITRNYRKRIIKSIINI